MKPTPVVTTSGIISSWVLLASVLVLSQRTVWAADGAPPALPIPAAAPGPANDAAAQHSENNESGGAVSSAGKAGPEAAKVDAIVVKHRALHAAILAAAKSRVAALLKAGPPPDPDKRKQWRKDVRAAIKTEHKAVDDASDSLRSDLEAMKKQEGHEK